MVRDRSSSLPSHFYASAKVASASDVGRKLYEWPIQVTLWRLPQVPQPEKCIALEHVGVRRSGGADPRFRDMDTS